ncbi:hypothetical protein D3C71_1578200 [compost metagenome]
MPHCQLAGSLPRVSRRCFKLFCHAVRTTAVRSVRWLAPRVFHHGESASAARRGRAASMARVLISTGNQVSPSSSCRAANASS